MLNAGLLRAAGRIAYVCHALLWALLAFLALSASAKANPLDPSWRACGVRLVETTAFRDFIAANPTLAQRRQADQLEAYQSVGAQISDDLENALRADVPGLFYGWGPDWGSNKDFELYWPEGHPSTIASISSAARAALSNGRPGEALGLASDALATIAQSRPVNDSMLIGPLLTKILAHWRLGEAGAASIVAKRLITVIDSRPTNERRALLRPELAAYEVATRVATVTASRRLTSDQARSEAASLAARRAQLVRQAALRLDVGFSSGITNVAAFVPGVSGVAALRVDALAREGLPLNAPLLVGGDGVFSIFDYFVESAPPIAPNPAVRSERARSVSGKLENFVDCALMAEFAYRAGDRSTGYAAALEAMNNIDDQLFLDILQPNREDAALRRAIERFSDEGTQFLGDGRLTLLFARDLYLAQNYAALQSLVARTLTPSLVRQFFEMAERDLRTRGGDGEMINLLRRFERPLLGLTVQVQSVLTTPLDRPREQVARLRAAGNWLRTNADSVVALMASLPGVNGRSSDLAASQLSAVANLMRLAPAFLEASAAYVTLVSGEGDTAADSARNISGDYRRYLRAARVPESRWAAAADQLARPGQTAQQLSAATSTLAVQSGLALFRGLTQGVRDELVLQEQTPSIEAFLTLILGNVAAAGAPFEVSDPQALFRRSVADMKPVLAIFRSAATASADSRRGGDQLLRESLGSSIAGLVEALQQGDRESRLAALQFASLGSSASSHLAVYVYSAYKINDPDFPFLYELVTDVFSTLDKEDREGRVASLLPNQAYGTLLVLATERADQALAQTILSVWLKKAGTRGLASADSGLDALQRSRAWANENSPWLWKAYLAGQTAASRASPTAEELDNIVSGFDQGRRSSVAEDTALRLAVDGAPDSVREAFDEWRATEWALEQSRGAERAAGAGVVSGIAAQFGIGQATRQLASIDQVRRLRQAFIEAAARAGTPITLDPPKFADLRAALAPSELFLSAVPFRDKVLVVAIPASGEPRVRFSNGATPAILERLKTLIASLSTERAPVDVAAAHALYRDLFSGVDDLVRAAGAIVWAPGEGLDRMPLGVLPLAAAANDPQWLALKTPIMTSPTIGVFVQQRKAGRLVQASSIFAVGDIPFRRPDRRLASALNLDIGDYSFDRRLPSTTLDALTPTPAAGPTFDALQARFGARTLRGQQATAPQVRAALRGQPVGLLVFHTHGLSAEETLWSRRPSPQSLALYPVPGGDDASGLFGMSDIAALETRARLVVLAACATSSPAEEGLEPISGIARAFLASGADAVVSSPVVVSDEGAGRLTVGIAEAMRAGQPPARALMLAQRAVYADPAMRHPWYWAPFEVIGEGLR